MAEIFPHSFGSFVLLGKIADGSKSEILKARAPQWLGQVVAIKRIRKEHLTNPHLLPTLKSEAITLSRLSHPNLVTVFTFSEENGQPYLVMEHVDSLSLFRLIEMTREKSIALIVPAMVYLSREVACALDYLHRHEILHTDLAARNILITRTGHIKLIDFSVAQTEFNLEKTGSPETWCALSDISPERARGEAFDERADIFQLGLVLYRNLVGKSPFGEAGADELYQKVCGFRVTPELFPETLHPLLKSILARSLAEAPRDRYASAKEMEKDLGKFLDQQHPDFNPLELGRFLEKLYEP